MGPDLSPGASLYINVGDEQSGGVQKLKCALLPDLTEKLLYKRDYGTFQLINKSITHWISISMCQ